MIEAGKDKRKQKKSSITPKHIVLRCNKSFYVYGACLILLGVILSLHSLRTGSADSGAILFLFLMLFLFGLYLICYCYRWEIRIFGNEITERTVWGRVNNYDLGQIESAKIVRNPRSGYKAMVIYSREKRLFFRKKLCIGEDSYGYDDFCELLRSHNIPIRW